MKTQSISTNLDYWLGYCRHIFYSFNGIINTVFLAKDIVVGDQYPQNNSVVLGSLVVDEVNIHLIDISNFCDKYNLNEDNKIKTILVFTILHELSHCDQDIDFLRTKNNRREVLKYEIENDYNTLEFITRNRELIMSIGQFIIYDPLLEMMRHKEPITLPFEKLEYRRIDNPYLKIISILTNITDENIYHIILNERVEFIKVRYFRQFILEAPQELVLMEYGRWLFPIQDSTLLKNAVTHRYLMSRVNVLPTRELIVDISE